jgi:cytochrome c oxidase subunit II
VIRNVPRIVTALITCTLLVQAGGAQEPQPRVIQVVAERFAFSPAQIVVAQGEVIEFQLTSDDTGHGFRIAQAGINVEIPKRRRGVTTVRFRADKPGTYIIECSRPCGAGHTTMRGVLIVR